MKSMPPSSRKCVRSGSGSGRGRRMLEALEPRVLLHGLTVITHGFELTAGTPNWLSEMGADMAARMGPGTSVYKMTLDYDSGKHPYISAFTLQQGPSLWSGTSATGEVVLLIDWSKDSGIGFPYPYISTTVIADVIAPWLMTPLTSNGQTVAPLAEGPIHMIGHSRGASLVSAIAADLGKAGIWVDQLTLLDPHPINSDATVVVSSNVIFADNYYETADVTPGSAVSGAYNLNLTSVDPSHSGIHAYYDGSIDLTATNDGDGVTISPSWYVSPARSATGFYYSRPIGGPRPSTGVGVAYGGSATRTAVTPSGTQWPSVGLLSASSASLLAGQMFDVMYSYQYGSAGGSIQFYLDQDRNPHDGNEAALGGPVPVTAAATVTQGLNGLTAIATPGIYYLEAVITNGSQTRIAYAPAAISVSAARVFYARSSFADVSHDAAIAGDKVPLLPGQTAAFSNYTSYSRGLNGVMLDLPGVVGALAATDFVFLVGGASPGDVNPASWAAAAAPAGILVRPTAGANGTTRVEISWGDNLIQNQWLRVTVKGGAGSASGLAADVVFYFGNAIGETGNDPAQARVDAVDELTVRAAAGTGAAITDVGDINRDGAVDGSDEDVVRGHVSWALNELQLIAAPAAGPALLTGAGVMAEAFDGSASKANDTGYTVPMLLVASAVLPLTGVKEITEPVQATIAPGAKARWTIQMIAAEQAAREQGATALSAGRAFARMQVLEARRQAEPSLHSEKAQRNPTCSEPVSRETPRRALGRYPSQY